MASIRACKPVGYAEINAKKFLELGEEIANSRTTLYVNEAYDANSFDEFKEGIRQHLIRVADLCVDLGLSVAAAVVESHVHEDKLPRTGEGYSILMETVYAEIRSRNFLYISQEKSKYYSNILRLPDSIRLAFPMASEELRLAGNCYATDLGAACVYHCMRALESGLRTLAADVGLTWTVEQWHVIINEIEAAIKKIGESLPRGQAKSERLQFLSEAAKEFAWFKDGWRNYSAHAHTSYESGEALKVMEHVTAFFGVLARYLKE